MGREIRKVPPGWEHPKQKCLHTPWAGGCGTATHNGDGLCYVPLYDDSYESAMYQYEADPSWYDHAPDPSSYRPTWKDSDATWIQMYETVSEGTPVSPPFAQPEDLIEYLVRHGDFWDQNRGHGGWNRESAERFVRRGWASSLIVTVEGEVKAPRDS